MGYDLTKSKDGFEPIEDGRYTLTVDSVEVTPHVKGDVTGEKIAITYKITDDGSYKNRKVWENIFVPWALFRARQVLEAMGSDVANSKDVTAEGIASAMRGRSVSAWIETIVGDNGKAYANPKEHKAIESVPEFSLLK